MRGLLERRGDVINFFLSAIGLKKEEVEDEVLERGEIERLISRDRFSRYIMPLYYDEGLGVYVNQDETIGIMYECVPVLFFSEKEIKTLASLFGYVYPKGTVIQFILYADPYIEHYLRRYLELKVCSQGYLQRAYRELAQFYRGAKGHLGYPVRNFRLFCCVKFPFKGVEEREIKEIKAFTYEVLKNSALNPIEVEPGDFLFFMRSLLNDVIAKEMRKADEEEVMRLTEVFHRVIPYKGLNSQILLGDTKVEARDGAIYFGERGFRCLSYKVMPEKVTSFFGNMMSGIYELMSGVSGDSKQVPIPFLISYIVFCDSINDEIHAKANLVMQQQGLGTFIISLKEKIDEYLWAVKKMNDGDRFMRVMQFFWCFSEDEDELRSGLHRWMRVLESIGGKVQEEKFISLPLFVYSLPFGGVVDRGTMTMLDRHYVVGMDEAAVLAPCQCDFLGTGEPILLFVGRKGQVVGVDFFSQRSANYNFFIAAPTGKGKSFLVNYIVSNYYGAGAKIRIIDIGGSYKKLCNMFGGRYLEFSPESQIVLNPFASIHDPDFDIPVLVSALTNMVTAVTGKLPAEVSEESAYNVMYLAVREVLANAEKEGKPFSECSIDDVYWVLHDFVKSHPSVETLCGKDHCIENFEMIASHLAFNLYKWTMRGPYGRWFYREDGEQFDISRDDFVVLELEHLKQQPDLFRVVTLLVLNAVTADLYLSDRTRPTLIVLDEAWQFLQDSPAFERVVEEGYRRARKYRGSFGVVTQDVLDFEGFGRVGRVIYSNSAFKFFLEGVKIELAKIRNIVEIDEFSVQLIKSLRYNAPRYSEIFMMTDNFGSGVVRLMVDPYSYYVYTSNPVEVAKIEELRRELGSYEAAIEEMLRRRG